MRGKHFKTSTSSKRAGHLVHGSWRSAGIKIASAGACALMVGQMLLPSVALATELGGGVDAAPAAEAVAAAPETGVVAASTTQGESGDATGGSADEPAAAGSSEPAQQPTADVQPATGQDQGGSADVAALPDTGAAAADGASSAGQVSTQGVSEVIGGSNTKVETTVRNNYTDTRTDVSISLVNGTGVEKGDYSSVNGMDFNFGGLGNSTVRATYDDATKQTMFTVDMDGIQRQQEDRQCETGYQELKSLMTTTYTGSKITYAGTTYEPGGIIVGNLDDIFGGSGGKAIIHEIRDDYYTRNHTYIKFSLTIPAAETSEIATLAVENVKFDYRAGDMPQATAWVTAGDEVKYEIVYECWQEVEGNEPVAAWYSDGKLHGSLPTIGTFEQGKKYVYSLMVKPKDGRTFTDKTVITVNGQKVTTPFVGGAMYIPAIKTITPSAGVEVRTIDVVEIDGVTVGFKDGDKPVFTGKVPDGANYAYRCEWWDLDGKTGAMSTDFGSFFQNKFSAFEGGKTYRYGVYVTAYGDVGNVRYIFGPSTKLKINGKFVNYTRYEGDDSDGSDGTMWVVTDLTCTPEVAPAPIESTPSEPEKPASGSEQKSADKGDDRKTEPATDTSIKDAKSTTTVVKTATVEKGKDAKSNAVLAATGDDALLTVVAMGVAGATAAAIGIAATKRRE